MNNEINALTSYFVDLYELKYLKIEFLNSEYRVTLTDFEGDSILSGYGNSIIEALNDLHHNLI